MSTINVEKFIFQPRNDTAANWALNNPVLRKGEFGIVTDSTTENWLKVGDGTTAWNSLAFKHGPQGIQGIQGIQGPAGNNGSDGQDGADGYTPVKGTDYFTPEDIASLNIPTNKALLDTYTQTEANLADAVSKKHSHSNKAVLDGIAGTDITSWNNKAGVKVTGGGEKFNQAVEASGADSHAENYGKAIGQASHAGGDGVTNADFSFAHGKDVTADRIAQATVGKYNKPSTAALFIVGNGTGTETANRKNAFEVDDSGNAVVEGKLTVGTAPSANMDVANKGYVDSVIASAIISALNTEV